MMGEELSSEVMQALGSWSLELPEEFDEHTPLFDSGILDSTALFNLVLWVEERTGRAIDPGSLDLRQEWQDVAAITRFIGSEVRQPTRPGSQQARGPATVCGPRIIRYRPEFKTRIAAELQTHLWSPDGALNTRYFEWLYESNPQRTETPLVYLALQGDQLVGMRGFWAARWEIGPATVPLLFADDLVIHPDFRDQGIHQQLMETAFTDLRHGSHSHAFNLSGSPINMLASLSMGWQRAGLMEMMGTRGDGTGGFARMRSALRKAPVGWRYSDKRLLYSTVERMPFRRFDRAMEAAQTLSHQITLSRQPRPDAMAALVSGRPKDGRIRMARDESTLTWRYGNPLRNYRFVYSGRNRLDGYLALSAPNGNALPGSRVVIADIEAASVTVFRQLLDATAGILGDLVTWTATLSPEEQTTLRDAGFVPVDLERRARGCPAALVRPLRADAGWSLHGKLLTDLRNWDLRPLFSMSA